MAQTNPANDLSDHWKINGNGWPGDLVITQASPGGRISGTMYGNTIVGYFAWGERTAVIVRYSAAGIPMQAYVGGVSVDGRTWTGKFYGLDAGPSGASQVQNVFAFTATRGTSTVPATPPVPRVHPGPSWLYDSFTIYNRPREYGTGWPGSLNVTLGSAFNPNFGQIQGTVFGDSFMGDYAEGSGTLAFLRLNNGQPAQIYISEDVGADVLVWRMNGTFYPLTEGMGASPSRLTYDWRAIVPECEVSDCTNW